MEERKANTQWHSLVNSGIRIELEAYAQQLQFEEEHKLGTGSKSIDLLIRKKEGCTIRKNIGHIFRGHNLFEVKGMADYLSIDAFYRTCGYGLFYKANTPLNNRIAIEDITFSFVTKRKPRKLIKHLERMWGLKCIKYAEGIYYLKDARIPVQLIITSGLDPKDNLWLQSLLNPIKSREVANELVMSYEYHKGDCNYEDVMQQIVKQNTLMFKKEEKIMCQALDELIEEGIQERIGKRIEEKVAEIIHERMKPHWEKLESQKRELEAQKEDIEAQKKDIKVQKEDIEIEKEELQESKRRLEQQARQLGIALV